MNNAEKIFDSINNFGYIISLIDLCNKKKQQIFLLERKRCGNCYHWMKSSCVPEKKRKEFKSCNSFACEDFERHKWIDDLIKKHQSELNNLQSEIKNMQTETEKRE